MKRAGVRNFDAINIQNATVTCHNPFIHANQLQMVCCQYLAQVQTREKPTLVSLSAPALGLHTKQGQQAISAAAAGHTLDKPHGAFNQRETGRDIQSNHQRVLIKYHRLLIHSPRKLLLKYRT